MKKGLLISIILSSSILNAQIIKEYGGEIRAGYIKVDNKKDIDTKAFGVGGNLFLKTKNYKGLSGYLSFYTLQDFGLNPKIEEIEESFYGVEKDGLTFVSQAYLDYENSGFEIKAGRFLFDSPHADSDDIRMVPNFFEGVSLVYGGYENFELTLAHLNKMAGWENSGDIKKFVNLNEVMGVEENTDGMSLASIGYEKDNFSASIWAYKIYDIANILYLEASYSFDFEDFAFNISAQIDKAKNSGKSHLDEIDSKTLGVMAQIEYKDLTLSGAFNKEYGDTKSMFSFGGGAFFTSMEDQTIDSVEDKDAKSYTLGAQYSLFDNFSAGCAYGGFEAGDKNDYNTKELDLYLNAKIVADIEAEVVYANINDKTANDEDYDIFRIILKRSF